MFFIYRRLSKILFLINLYFLLFSKKVLFSAEKNKPTHLSEEKKSFDTSLIWTCQYSLSRSVYSLEDKEFYYSNSAGLALGLGVLGPYNFLRLQFEGEFGPLREDRRLKFNTNLQGYKISSFFDFFWDSLAKDDRAFFGGTSLGLSYQDFIQESVDTQLRLRV